MSDLISRAALHERINETVNEGLIFSGMTIAEFIEALIDSMPSADPLTDVEQRIFLKAISREEEVCRKVDAEWGEGDEECEINLVHVCHEIVRKVKGALWT